MTGPRLRHRPPASRESGGLLDPHGPEWSAALALACHDVYHLPQYAAIEAEIEGGVAAAFCYREGNSVLLLPIVLHPTPGMSHYVDACTPYGYSGPVTNVPDDQGFTSRALASLLRVLRANRVVTLFARLHPLLPAPWDRYAEIGTVTTHGQTVSVDLSRSDAEIWSATRRGHRNQINRARNSGLRVVFDDWSVLDSWITAYYANMQTVGALQRYFFPREYFLALRQRLPAEVHLAVALAPDGAFVGGTLLFERSRFVQAHLAATQWEHPLSANAGKLLDDEARRWAKQRGALIYHLGGGIGGEHDSLFDYKAGFSDQRHVFRTWRVVVNRDAYAALLGALPPSPHGFFPAYRRATDG